MDERARWNARYAEGGGDAPPAAFLVDRAGWLPAEGRALDLAGGTGRNALWLAARGLDVTLVDVSDEACAVARRRARTAGLPLTVVRRDLSAQPPPAGPWDVVLVHRYLDRALLRTAPGLLGAGGVLLISHPTARNLERHDRPSRRHLLRQGELARLVDASGFEVLERDEGWTETGHHEARLVLRRS